MVLAGLGLNPAGVSLFRMHAPQSPCDEELASAWGLNPRVLRALILVVASSFVCGCIASSFCFFRPSERNVRQFYGGWFWHGLGQVWAWILLGFLRACDLSFVCGCIAHLSVSLGRQNATLGSFTGDGFGRFGLESCWGFPVSDACPTEPFDEELASAWGLNPRVLRALIIFWWLHHLSVSLGRQNATLGTFTGDGFGRFGLESCWGFCFGRMPHRALWRGILPLEAWILAFFGPWSWNLGGCIIFCLWLHCIIFLFL